MEYLNGGDLDAMLRHMGCLSLDTVQIYVAQLVLALEYLHGQAFILIVSNAASRVFDSRDG